jgi:hypothetical protein
MTSYANEVFAPVDRDHAMERIAGGNETEVYQTDDRTYVVKLKSDLGGAVEAATRLAHEMRDAADTFAHCLGPEHSIPSYYVVACDAEGKAQVLVLQPFLQNAQALATVDYDTLSHDERVRIAAQLREIIRRSLSFYRATGSMPDLYGRSSTSSAERKSLNTWNQLPRRLWSFIVRRNLLRSHNLMLTDGPERRLVLVDYDIVRRGKLYRTVYYRVRWMLFWRDHALIAVMREGGAVPRISRQVRSRNV